MKVIYVSWLMGNAVRRPLMANLTQSKNKSSKNSIYIFREWNAVRGAIIEARDDIGDNVMDLLSERPPKPWRTSPRLPRLPKRPA
jgi:hypothetical protein